MRTRQAAHGVVLPHLLLPPSRGDEKGSLCPAPRGYIQAYDRASELLQRRRAGDSVSERARPQDKKNVRSRRALVNSTGLLSDQLRFEPQSIEPHYTPAEVAERLKLSARTVQRIFRDEPGVIKLSITVNRRRRPKVTLRIPESVVLRVLRRLGR
jgi:AraC-like DNA-binding protein